MGPRPEWRAAVRQESRLLRLLARGFDLYPNTRCEAVFIEAVAASMARGTDGPQLLDLRAVGRRKRRSPPIPPNSIVGYSGLVATNAAAGKRSGGTRKAAKRGRAQTRTPVASAWLSQERTAFVVDHLGGVRAVAALLGVSPSQPTRWQRGEETPGPEAARMLVDLDHVVATLLQVWHPEVATDWLHSANAHLNGARPIDVLRARGSAEVVAAARAEAAGAYA